MWTEVVLPLTGLAVLAWIVPWALGRLLPEGVPCLLLNGALSALILALASAVGFVVLYGAAGAAVWHEAPWHFVLLAARSALVWAPVMVLSVANLPRGWTEAEW